MIPESETRFYDEAVVWLPDSYQANDSKRPRPAPPSRAAAGLPEQGPEKGFVFCNFNQAYKLGPEIFARWMRILRACDDSLLWLLADNEVFTANLKREAEKQGVAPERLIFAPGLQAGGPSGAPGAGRPVPGQPALQRPHHPPAMRCGRACRCSPAGAPPSPAASPPAC